MSDNMSKKEIQKYKRRWNKHCVETIKYSAMSGKDASGIFDIQASFDEWFHEIPLGAEEQDHRGQRQPVG